MSKRKANGDSKIAASKEKMEVDADDSGSEDVGHESGHE